MLEFYRRNVVTDLQFPCLQNIKWNFTVQDNRLVQILTYTSLIKRLRSHFEIVTPVYFLWNVKYTHTIPISKLRY